MNSQCALGSTESGGIAALPGSGDPLAVIPALAGPGHADHPGREASSGPAALFDSEDGRLALERIRRELDKPVVIDSDNARSRREILRRQQAELEARL
jgi:hypothetical protein